MAAREGYLKSLDNDNIQEITRMASENPTNLIGFNESVEAYSKSVMQNVDPASKGAVALSIDSMVARFRPRIQSAAAQKVIDEGNEEQLINARERTQLAVNSALDGDTEQSALNMAAAFDSISNRSDLGTAQKGEAIRKIQLEVTEATFSKQINDGFDEGGINGAFETIDGLKKPKDFTRDEWDSFLGSEQKKINRRQAREKQVSAEQVKAAQLEASQQRGLLFSNPSIPADPAKGSQDREDINNHYDQVSATWTQLPTQDQVNLNVDFVKNTGLIPNQLISTVNAYMRSGQPDQVGLMSDVLSRIQEDSPAALKDIPEESRAMSLQVSDAVRAGIDPDIAMELARTATFGMTAQQKETIKLQTSEKGFSNDLSKSLQSFVDQSVDKGGFDQGIFFGVPDTSPAMLGEYRTSFDRFMQMTNGNVDQSQLLAFQAVKSTWGITETGGPKRFMKFSPEVLYNVPNFGNQWIEEQFNEEMELKGFEGAILAIDDSVGRETQPSYPILTADNEGRLIPVFEDDQALRWKPDFRATEEFKELMGAPGRALESAKQQRENKLVRRANEIRRGVQSRVLSFEFVPANERKEFLASDRGKRITQSAINNMLAAGRIDAPEAVEARKAFGVANGVE